MIEYVNLREPYLAIGYDCEMSENVSVELKSLEIISKTHMEQGVHFTMFILGELLESDKICDCLSKVLKQEIFNRLADLQQHSYSHTEFKRIRPERDPLTIPEIREEVRRTNKLIYDSFGIECHGIRAPLGHYQGFRSNHDILEALYAENMLSISSDLRNKQNAFPSEWRDEDGNHRQPYFYDRVKYPDLLEIPTHGWNDNALKGMSETTKIRIHSLEEELDVYKHYLNYAMENDLVYAPLFHTWAIAMTDIKGFVINGLLKYAKENDVKIVSYKQLYDIVVSAHTRHEHTVDKWK